ncbi:hypothetical protein DDE84_00335 [Bifidobacterium tibiigranuli]|uniref:Uncharacterized protein n=1 Tax=Bifidobacterium tibiigranuli TaxID=2172043 RepID=A0A5N6S7C0_9BIFI|nr:hypothetical protein DDE84_00335 [Bifidobacterium tibiigranuli]KAE8130566.1 hypothetical protein DDF78_01320 [Bifidobacterium tibiigranuli]
MVLLTTLAFACFSVSVCLATLHGSGLNESNIFDGRLLWCVYALLLSTYIYGTPGYLSWTRAERRILNDEFTKVNRANATRWAFGVFCASGFVQCLSAFRIWTAPVWWPIASISAALVAAGISFAVTDIRANV